MHHRSYARALRMLAPSQRRGLIVLLLVQDDLLLAETIAHYRQAGAACILAIGPEHPVDGADHSAPFEVHRAGAMAAAANGLMRAAPGAWVLPCWGGDRLIWPHGDTRPLTDLLMFLGDEKRDVLGGVVLDSYPDPSGHWHIDRLGYRQTAAGITGGLRIRIGPDCPAFATRLDGPMVVKATPGVVFDTHGRLNEPELNRLHTPWHHSPTAAIVSPRVWAWAQAQSEFSVRTTPYHWAGSHRLDRTATDLWELGMIEPGQWV